MITITQMKYILAVEETLHFGRAAKACHVSQPSLSMQLQKAEDLLGVIIFDRSKNPIRVTDLGKKVVDQCKMIMKEYGRLSNIVDEDTDEVKGSFKLGIIPTLAPYVTPLFIESFCHDYPLVNLTIEEMKTQDIVLALEKDLIDGAILVTPLGSDKIVERVLFYEEMKAYVSKKSSLLKSKTLKPRDISQKGLWILNEGHCFRDQVFNLCQLMDQKGVSPAYENLFFESGNLETLKRIVDKGDGHTILPYLATLNFTAAEKKKLKDFTGSRPTREVSLIHARLHLKENIIEALERSIIDCLPQGVESRKSKKMSVVSIN